MDFLSGNPKDRNTDKNLIDDIVILMFWYSSLSNFHFLQCAKY